MADISLFVGPYVECFTPAETWPDCQGELARAWDKLLNDDRRLRWNIGRGDPRTVVVRGKPMWQFCGVPVGKRRGSPRPMFWELDEELSSSGDCLTFDWQVLDRAAELGWFREAYAEELGLLARIFKQAPTLRWGMVSWSY